MGLSLSLIGLCKKKSILAKQGLTVFQFDSVKNLTKYD